MTEQQAPAEGQSQHGDVETAAEFLTGSKNATINGSTGEAELQAVHDEFHGNQAPAEDNPAPAETTPSEPAKARPSDTFKDGEAAREGYDHLKTRFDAQGNELGQLRAEIAEMRGRQAATESFMKAAPAQPAQPAQPSVEEQAFTNLVRMEMDLHGLTEAEARDAASRTMASTQAVIREKVEAVERRYKPIAEDAESQRALTARVSSVAGEVDQATGQPVRGDWEEVILTPEFAQVMQGQPELADTEIGLKYAYSQTKLLQEASPERQAKEANRIAAEAQEVVDGEKRRASTAAGTSSVPTHVDEDEAEIQAIYESGKGRHFLMGGQ